MSSIKKTSHSQRRVNTSPWTSWKVFFICFFCRTHARVHKTKGLDVLQLLTIKVNHMTAFLYSELMGDSSLAGKERMEGGIGTNPQNLEGLNRIDPSSLNIVSIQTKDSASIFIKQSHDDSIKFIPFRKPKDSPCSRADYVFSNDCINAHGVRQMSFADDELVFC